MPSGVSQGSATDASDAGAWAKSTDAKSGILLMTCTFAPAHAPFHLRFSARITGTEAYHAVQQRSKSQGLGPRQASGRNHRIAQAKQAPATAPAAEPAAVMAVSVP